MSLLDAIRRVFRPEERALSPNQAWAKDWGWDDTGNTSSSIRVTRDAALGVSAYMSGVRLLVNTISTLPADFYGTSGAEVPAPRWATRPQPDPNVTFRRLRSEIVMSLLIDGNAFIYCLPSVEEAEVMFILDPSAVDIKEDGSDSVKYRIGVGDPLTPSEIIHVPLLTLPGKVRGMNPITYARETLGVSIAADEYGARYFANGANPSLAIETPGSLTEEQAESLREKVNARIGGPKNAHLVGILTGGATFKALSLSPEDSQFLELRSFQVHDVARLLNIPPVMLASMEPGAASYSSVEQQAIFYEKHAVRPIVTIMEDGFKRPLRTGHMKLNTKGLLRGDVKTQAEFYAIGLQNKFLQVDEVRGWEDLDPLGGVDGGLLETPNNNAPDARSAPMSLAVHDAPITVNGTPITLDSVQIGEEAARQMAEASSSGLAVIGQEVHRSNAVLIDAFFQAAQPIVEHVDAANRNIAQLEARVAAAEEREEQRTAPVSMYVEKDERGLTHTITERRGNSVTQKRVVRDGAGDIISIVVEDAG